MQSVYPNRQSIRLSEYDYSQPGSYFITICTEGRMALFGEIVNGKMILNDAGTMIEKWWNKLSEKFDIECEPFIVMPNHFHGMITIPSVGAKPCFRPLVPHVHPPHSHVHPPHSHVHPPHSHVTPSHSHSHENRSYPNIHPPNSYNKTPMDKNRQNNNICQPNIILGNNENRGLQQNRGENKNTGLQQNMGLQQNRGENKNMGLQQNRGENKNTGENKNMGENMVSPLRGLGRYISWFKRMSTNEYIRAVKQFGWQRFNGKLWQRNYWEHIVRNEPEFDRICGYIRQNPEKWGNDKLNGGVGNVVMEAYTPYNDERWMV